MINTVQFINEDNTEVMVTTSIDQKIFVDHPDSKLDINTEINDWVALGNSISPYEATYMYNLEQLRQVKIATNFTHIKNLQKNAESNYDSSHLNLNDEEYKKANIRRSMRILNPSGANHNDSILANFILDIIDTLDVADAAVNSFTTRAELVNWHPSNISWPVWTPPTS